MAGQQQESNENGQPPGDSFMRPPGVVVRMLRSPSHESVTTELSLLSISSISMDPRRSKMLSPNPDNRPRPADIPEVLWFEEETEVIKNCAALSSALGLQKSFSTTDISQLPIAEDYMHTLRNAVSELALSAVQKCGYILNGRLEGWSRSVSTWVAVGGSQLPSPRATPHHPTTQLTPQELIRSVNKKVRQNYLRRRLLTTYRAIERLSQSEFNLDKLEAAASSSSNRLQVPSIVRCGLSVTGSIDKPPSLPLTVNDVERERGKPLSKYDRNMMIFNWLHTLDPEQIAPPP